jgi:hypothetical protein
MELPLDSMLKAYYNKLESMLLAYQIRRKEEW